MAVEESVRNKQVILKNHVSAGVPKESDMELEIRENNIELKVAEGTKDAILIKNLYLSGDPYMRSRMKKMEGWYVASFEVGSPITGYGVAKVVDSTHPEYKKGDFIWGMTGWEDYSLMTTTHGLFKKTS